MGAAAALDMYEDTSTTTAATCTLSEDTNAAAAIEKAQRRDVMSKSQENKNEKINEGDNEFRRLVEERRNTAKGEKHKVKELGKRVKKKHQGKKKEQNDKNRYNRFSKNVEVMHKILEGKERSSRK